MAHQLGRVPKLRRDRVRCLLLLLDCGVGAWYLGYMYVPTYQLLGWEQLVEVALIKLADKAETTGGANE